MTLILYESILLHKFCDFLMTVNSIILRLYISTSIEPYYSYAKTILPTSFLPTIMLYLSLVYRDIE